MTDTQTTNNYLSKAVESLEGAESEQANRRFNNCVNRCYYACFQAAIAPLLGADIDARSPGGRWRHDHVQAQFVGQLVNRRKLYQPALRRALSDTIVLRRRVDYEADSLSELQAFRAVRRSRDFVGAIKLERDGRL
jgi:uncharacterized protein (UPF0332 family)